MSQSLTFYSVTLPQLNAALKSLGLSQLEPSEPDTRVVTGSASGETPVGKLACDLALHTDSGQLTVTVTEKPMLITMAAVQHHIQSKLNESIAETAPAAVAETAAQD